MKQVLFACIFLLAGQALSAQNDAITKYFNQYKDDASFTIVNVSPKLFEMIANIASEEVEDPEVLEMIKEMKGLKILKTELTPMKFYEEAIAKIDTKDYEELLTVRDEDQNVRIMVKDEDGGNIVNEMLLLVGGKDEFVLLSFVGKLHLNKLAKLAKNMDIEGMEHLEKLDKE
jgi:hypothetical protein